MMDGTGHNVVVAGGAGDLGHRFVRELVRRHATVSVLVRKGTPEFKKAAVLHSGATLVELDYSDAVALRQACVGASCVVSVLNGLEPVMIDMQTALLDAAVAAGVPRFIPSDFSLDFTKTRPGDNRNMDLRRRFQARADSAPLQVLSVLNGMFTDLLTGEAPIVMRDRHRILSWGNVDQPLDFTTKDDIADFTADVILDPDAPRFSRIAGDCVSSRDLARIMTSLTGQEFKILRPGGLGLFGIVIALVRSLSPRTDDPFPAWQGMQYMRDVLSGRGKREPLYNSRSGKAYWTRVAEVLADDPAEADLRA